MYRDLTKSSITKGLVLFALPMMAGNLFQQFYNIADTLIVGQALGNSVTPLWFLGISTVLNIGLDLLFVLVFHWGIAGAAFATILAQYVSCIGLLLFVIFRCKELLPEKKHFQWNKEILKEIFDLSILTCAQQSAMNFGILLVQRLVDSFGAVTMAAFASPLMKIFVKAQETDVIACGVRYLRIEGAFYIGIGCLFLLYGLYRGVERPACL